MKQLFRVTYDESDYTYQIVNETPINHSTSEFQILIEGEKYVLIKDSKKFWVDKDGNTRLDPYVLNAIGRSISLRYRM